MTSCSDMPCGKDPRYCPHAVEEEDGESYYSGLPIRFYRPGEACPETPENIAKELHESRMDDYLSDIAYGLGLR